MIIKSFSKILILIRDFIFPPSEFQRSLDNINLPSPEKIIGADSHYLFKYKTPSFPPAKPVDNIFKYKDTFFPPAQPGHSLFKYKDPLINKLIKEMKYKGNEKIFNIFGEVLYEYLKSNENIYGHTLIPIPISKRRKFERGFNQTEKICEVIRKLDRENGNLFKYDHKILTKKKHTQSQTKMKNDLERFKNMENVFEVKNKNRGLVKDLNIILIDDVLTTGATLNSARETLLKHGAKKVLFLTIAH